MDIAIGMQLTARFAKVIKKRFPNLTTEDALSVVTDLVLETNGLMQEYDMKPR